MQANLSALDIDKYQDWYEDLAVSLHFSPSLPTMEKRYAAAAWWCSKRGIIDPRNTISAAMGKHFIEKAKECKAEISRLKPYTDGLAALFFMPTLSELSDIKTLINGSFEQSVEEYQEKIGAAALSEIDVARDMLKRVETEYLPAWIEYAKAGQPIPKTPTALSDLAIGIANIRFAKFLAARIAQSSAPNDANNLQDSAKAAPLLQWKGRAQELFTLFSDMKDVDLIAGANADIARLICERFADEHGRPFTFSNVQTKLNGGARSRKRADFSDFT